MEALGFLFLWILLIAFFLVFVFILIWIFSSFKNKTPFFTSPTKTLPYIYKALDLNDNSVFFDIGSGDLRVVRYVAFKNKNTKCYGIENNISALILSKITLLFSKKSKKENINLINKNFFDADLSIATHIFSYIYPNAMDDLLPKLDKELKPGTHFVSMNYRFTNKVPIAEIDLERGKYKLARKLYIYVF